MIPKPTTQQQATANAIDALGEAENMMRRTLNPYQDAEYREVLTRHAEVWSSIGTGWAAVANVLPSVDYQVKDDGSPGE